MNYKEGSIYQEQTREQVKLPSKEDGWTELPGAEQEDKIKVKEQNK